MYYEQHETSAAVAGLNQSDLRKSRGDSLDIKFYYATTPLSVWVVLVKIVLAIALLGGLSLVLPQLDAVYDEYIPYFREHGLV